MNLQTDSSALATSKKLHRVQQCLADLQERGMGDLVESVLTLSYCDQPCIRLNQKPEGIQGCIVRIVRRLRVQTMVALHKDCQLRWDEVLP